MDWEELIVTLGPTDGDGNCAVRAVSSVGQARSSFRVDKVAEGLGRVDEIAEGLHRACGKGAVETGGVDKILREIAVCLPPPPDARESGSLLFDLVFTGLCRDLFHLTDGLVRATGRGLKVVLAIDPAERGGPWLQSLPWEQLYQPARQDFIALMERRSIVRHFDLVAAVEEPVLSSGRVLAVAGSLAPGLEPLELEREARALREIWGGGDFEVLSDMTIEEVAEYMRATGPYQLIHFMGHAAFVHDIGKLLFSDGNNGVQAVDGQRLVQAFAAQGQGIALVFLNACRTGRLGQEVHPFAGLATALAVRVRVVLTMREAISDGAAICFSEAVYRDLDAGCSLDEAVQAGRLRIGDEWSQPILVRRSAPFVPRRDLWARLYKALFRLPSSLRRVGVWGGLLGGGLLGLVALAIVTVVQSLAPSELPWLAGLALLGLTTTAGAVLGRLRFAYDVRVLALCALLMLALIGVRPLVPRRADVPLSSVGNFSAWMAGVPPPSRWLGFSGVQEGCRSESCLRFTYRPGAVYAGMYWVPWACPEGDLGDRDCGIDLLAGEATRIRRVTFHARGERGGEALEFKFGFDDSPATAVRRAKVVLTTEWRRYTLPLEGVDLHDVIGLFGWFGADVDHHEEMSFYLDDVVFEGVFCPLDRR